MNRRMLLLFTALLSTAALSSQEPSDQQAGIAENNSSQEQSTATTEPTIDVQVNTPEQVATQKPIKPKPRTTIIGSFYRFLRLFIALLNNQKIQNNIKTLESLLSSLMQTAYQVIQNSSPTLGATRNCRDEMALDPQLVQEMETIIAQESKQIMIKKNQSAQTNKAPDDPTKVILANFAGVVASFFNILQDPENKDVVAPNLINMVAGMVNIGTEAMKKDGPPLKARYDELDRYVQNLDEDLKKDMLRIIFNEQKRIGILAAEE